MRAGRRKRRGSGRAETRVGATGDTVWPLSAFPQRIPGIHRTPVVGERRDERGVLFKVLERPERRSKKQHRRTPRNFLCCSGRFTQKEKKEMRTLVPGRSTLPCAQPPFSFCRHRRFDSRERKSPLLKERGTPTFHRRRPGWGEEEPGHARPTRRPWRLSKRFRDGRAGRGPGARVRVGAPGWRGPEVTFSGEGEGGGFRQLVWIPGRCQPSRCPF